MRRIGIVADRTITHRDMASFSEIDIRTVVATVDLLLLYMVIRTSNFLVNTNGSPHVRNKGMHIDINHIYTLNTPIPTNIAAAALQRASVG